MELKICFIFIVLSLAIKPSLNSPITDGQDALLDELTRILKEKLQVRDFHVDEDFALRNFDEKDPGITPLVDRGLQAKPLKIAAFNIQIFGTRKYDNQAVKDILIQIMLRYDLVLVQEIRDSSQTAFPKLMNDLNSATNGAYASVVSARLGRSTSKEQYAYVYKKSRLEVLATYTYNDTSDYFEREPYCAHFKSLDSAVPDFGVIGIHTKPHDADEEISRLVDVHDQVSPKFQTKNIILMGDFNTGCSYVTQSEWDTVKLRTDERFTWLIGDDVDTTVSASDCAYDRFVVAGDVFKHTIVPGSAKIFNFPLAYQLEEAQAKEVSDHYVIEMEIYGLVDNVVKAAHPRISFRVESSTPAAYNPMKLTSEAAGSSPANFTIALISETDNAMETAINVKASVNCQDVIAKLNEFMKLHPKMMSEVEIALVETYLATGFLNEAPPIPGVYIQKAAEQVCMLDISYRILEPYSYSVIVSKYN